MLVGERLRAIRELKNLSQGDIEKRTGLSRCYISRVENGYSVPAIETLEKFALALEIPVYYLFYDGEELPGAPEFRTRETPGSESWGSTRKHARMLAQFRKLLGLLDERNREALMSTAGETARRAGAYQPRLLPSNRGKVLLGHF